MRATTRNNLKPSKKGSKPDIMPGKPFQSKLGDHYETIRAMRRKKATWDAIAAHLKTLGVTTNKGSLCAFFKRHSKRPYALGMEPDEASSLPKESPVSQPGIPPTKKQTEAIMKEEWEDFSGKKHDPLSNW